MTFSLTLFGTFLTRSGVIASVHAFTQGSIGVFFLSFLAVVLLLALALLAWRWDTLGAQGELDSVVSRESAFLLNNVLLVAAAFTVFFGTVFPLLSEAVRGVKVSVGAPFFDQVNVPLFLGLIFLMAWGRSSPGGARRSRASGATSSGRSPSHRRRRRVPAAGRALDDRGALAGADGVCGGDDHRRRDPRHAGARADGRALPGRARSLLLRHNRRYGGFVVHLGILVVALGITGSQAWSVQTETTLRRGEHTDLAVIACGSTGSRRARSRITSRSPGRSRSPTGAAPAPCCSPRRSSTPRAVADRLRGLPARAARDVYLVLGDFARDGSQATVRLQVNRLVSWIWIGGFILTLAPCWR